VAVHRRSVHDPDGFVVDDGTMVYRWVCEAANSDFAELLGAEWYRRQVDNGLIVGTDRVGADALPAAESHGDRAGAWYTHRRIAFPTYPHEWPPDLLLKAGELVLNLQEQALQHGYTLKDAHARNVLFDGADPVFVDVLSLKRRVESTPLWRAHGQFERHFTLPLIAFRELGIPPSTWHWSYRDGVAPEVLYRAMGPTKWLKPSVLGAVTAPSMLAALPGSDRLAKVKVELPTDAAKEHLLRRTRSTRHRLIRLGNSLAPPASTWTRYSDSGSSHYTDEARSRKRSVIAAWLDAIHAQSVLDIGANTGVFSMLAAATGAFVVAIDSDVDALRELCRTCARDAHRRILPLHVDFSATTPALGWNGSDARSFDERAALFFDAVLALAVIHHLMAAGRIPPEEIVDKIADYCRGHAIIEYIAPEDPRFKEISRKRDCDFSFFSEEVFRRLLSRRFDMIASERISDSRTVYLCKKCR
jgi:2-polyprenyl-3-methyl-5-hydroxy-6-metoxy-1,4-benzoquinol methylase